MPTTQLLTHGRILSDHHDAGEAADILVEGGTIVQLAAPGQLSREGREVIDATDCLVLPGLVNGHTHSHGALARGLVQDKVSLEGFLASMPAVTGQRTLDDLKLSAELNAVELVRRGCTSCIDMALQLPLPTPEGLIAIGQAYQSVGLRAVIAPMVAHGVWLDDDDMQALHASGTMVIHNPLSNLRLGSGIAPVRRLVQSQVGVAVGTDASNTSDGQNLFEAIRMASYLSRMASPDWSEWLSADEAWQLAPQGGARVMGLPDRLGRVAPGYLADLTLVDLRGPHYTPLRHLLKQTVFGESGAGIRHVMVNGRMVFSEGRVLGIDEAALRQRAEAAAHRLDAALAKARANTAALNPWLFAFCCDTPGPDPRTPRRVLY